MTPLILASASPRRRDLLQQAGYQFDVEVSSVPEHRQPEEDPVRFVTRLARQKAEAVFARCRTAAPRIVLGADTVVVCDEEVMGKPSDPADAVRMLHRLAGRTHAVITGAAAVWGTAEMSVEAASERTWVTMRTLSSEEIVSYVAGGEPFDKAGAYAIQGYAARWIPRINGCYFNVVGLPLALVASLLEAAEQRLRGPA